jgi:hypothetical protein
MTKQQEYDYIALYTHDSHEGQRLDFEGNQCVLSSLLCQMSICNYNVRARNNRNTNS